MACQAGSLCEGTTHPADVIPRLAEFADFYAHERYLNVIEQAHVDDDLEDYLFGEGRDSSADPEDVSWLLEQLMDVVQSVLPEGFYVGTHWGDGADFGIWPTE